VLHLANGAVDIAFVVVCYCEQVQQHSALFCMASACTKVCNSSARWLGLYTSSSALWHCANP